MTVDNVHAIKLEWDSHFFQKNVYRVDTSSYSEWKQCLAQTETPAMFYIFADNAISELSESLMDHKLTYSIDVVNSVPVSGETSCVFYDGQNAKSGELEHLAILSSGNSRFRVDGKIPKSKVDELFTLWIRNALTPNPTTQILLKHIEGRVAGMVSFRANPKILKIELVAVHEDFQRRGCAAELMNACIAYAQKNSIERVEVVTQEVNKGACELYRRAGFKLVDSKYIYHVHTD